jgi:hypothetical protein
VQPDKFEFVINLKTARLITIAGFKDLIEPMSLDLSCWICHHRAVLNVAALCSVAWRYPAVARPRLGFGATPGGFHALTNSFAFADFCGAVW